MRSSSGENMKIDKKILQHIPKLYEQEELGDEAIVYVRLYEPLAQWSWYVLEYDGMDTCFGYVKGFENEFGYFCLSEMENTLVMVDMEFEPTKMKDIL
jgi:hypothetical protein